MKTKKLNGSSEKCFDEKFRIMHFLDSIRWQNSGNYYTINCAYPNKSKNIALTDDEKLLNWEHAWWGSVKFPDLEIKNTEI